MLAFVKVTKEPYDTHFGVFDDESKLRREMKRIIRESDGSYVRNEKINLVLNQQCTLDNESLIPLKYKIGLEITEVFRTEEQSDGFEIQQCSHLLLLASECEEGMYTCLMLEKNKFRNLGFADYVKINDLKDFYPDLEGIDDD